jgi:hypothetical protein
MITKPLHVATIGRSQLRFFRTPNDDGRPDFPWHAVDDLQQCLGLSDIARDRLQTSYWRDAELRKFYRTIACNGELIVIAPHCAAQGMIGAAIEFGVAPSRIRAEYQMAGCEAAKKLTAHLSDGDALRWAAATMLRHEKE